MYQPFLFSHLSYVLMQLKREEWIADNDEISEEHIRYTKERLSSMVS